jgi:hypothetical protein
MAQDKRGQIEEPTVEEGLEEIGLLDSTDEFVAGPTSRNEAGDMKRAAAKATGLMGASVKLDPDLAVDPDGGRVRSGSNAGLHTFDEVDPALGETPSMHLSNEEIAEAAATTARHAPAVSDPEEADRIGLGKRQ